MPDYLVTVTVPPNTNAEATPQRRERILRAKNEAAAIRHVVSDTISVERLRVDDAMRLATTGVTLELVTD